MSNRSRLPHIIDDILEYNISAIIIIVEHSSCLFSLRLRYIDFFALNCTCALKQFEKIVTRYRFSKKIGMILIWFTPCASQLSTV